MDTNTQRVCPDERARRVYNWITQQICTRDDLHEDEIIREIADEITRAESAVRDLPRYSFAPDPAKITTRTKAQQLMYEVLDEIAYLGKTQKNGMPLQMAMKTLAANKISELMIGAVNKLLIEQMDSFLRVLNPLLERGCPETFAQQLSLNECYYCKQKLEDKVCGNTSGCPWAYLYNKAKG